MIRKTPPFIRLLQSRNVDPDTGCWQWQKYTDREGYGYTTGWTGQKVRAHRLAYELFRGPIGAGLVTDHLCENTSCINPWHLELVTNAENMRRRSLRMTTCRRGHPRTPENARRRRSGKVDCRVCDRLSRRAAA